MFTGPNTFIVFDDKKSLEEDLTNSKILDLTREGRKSGKQKIEFTYKNKYTEKTETHEALVPGKAFRQITVNVRNPKDPKDTTWVHKDYGPIAIVAEKENNGDTTLYHFQGRPPTNEKINVKDFRHKKGDKASPITLDDWRSNLEKIAGKKIYDEGGQLDQLFNYRKGQGLDHDLKLKAKRMKLGEKDFQDALRNADPKKNLIRYSKAGEGRGNEGKGKEKGNEGKGQEKGNEGKGKEKGNEGKGKGNEGKGKGNEGKGKGNEGKGKGNEGKGNEGKGKGKEGKGKGNEGKGKGKSRGLETMERDNSGNLYNDRKFKKKVRNEVVDFNKASQLKVGVSNYNNNVVEKQKNSEKLDKKDKLGAAGDLVSSGIGLYKSIKSGDGFGIASSVIGTIAVGAAFVAPPVGTAVAILAGVAGSLISLFAPSGPSDVEIIGNLIQEQTEQIESMIEDQTRILLKALNQLSEENRKLADYTISEILKDNYYQMIDDMKGVTASLKMKKGHLSLYQDACISQWPEISVESDMNQINFQMGRIGAFLQRFCQSIDNMEFCGRLLLEYSLLATLRNAVRTATLYVVERSGFHNKEFKRSGLIKEHYTTLELDRNILRDVISNSKLNSPYCHVACALRDAKNTLQSKFDEKTVDATTLNLTEDEKGFLHKFLEQLGISLYTPEKDLEDCSVCYQRGIGCKDENRPRGVKATHKRNKTNGKCEETLSCQDSEWKFFRNPKRLDACYRFFKAEKNYDEARNLCKKHGASLTSIRSREELDFLLSLNSGLRFITYGKRICHNCEKDKSFAFRWEDEDVYEDFTSFEESWWQTGQPDNYKNDEDCLEWWRNGFNDVHCASYKDSVMCKKDI